MQHTKPRYPLPEGFRLLGLSRSKGYARIQRGELHVIHDGQAAFVTAAEIDRYASVSHPPIPAKEAVQPPAP